MSTDATPAYRGYRLQHLYTLWRILGVREQENIVFQLEGQEDLDILNSRGTLLEVLQVKAYSDELVLSTFSPNKADSFFYRIDSLMKNTPDLHCSIISFGPVGSELFQALEKDGSDRQKIAQKLSKSRFLSLERAKEILQSLHLTSVNERELTENVFVLLRQSLMGVDPENAFDLLSFWLYRCAEKKALLTRQDVIKKVNSVGKFLAERAAHHQEWFTSITPIEDYSVEAQREALHDAFFQGVSARYSHILADLDVQRPQKLQEIAQKFQQHNIVIVHGASGQGKSTLAYRYMREYVPNQWRFQVHLINGREHAFRIARALHSHAEAMDIPLTVYIDVSSRDHGWVDLIEQLSDYQQIFVLVTIREEDFRRAVISSMNVNLETIHLTLNKSEAELIYYSINETKQTTHFLHFQDAWRIFGGEGPLMEFIYLLTQGESLRERLSAQIKRLENDILSHQYPPALLDLLRIVSVASAYEVQIKAKPLVSLLQIAAPARVLELLEEEYLVRRSEDKTLLQGLHPIRSTILADLLTAPPALDTWIESACTCLPLLDEADVEVFLLYAFSRHQEVRNELLAFLTSYQASQWTVIAGIMRALLWLGVRDYTEMNQILIQNAAEKYGRGWYIILDSDIANAAAELQWEDRWGSLIPPEQVREIRTLRARQSNKVQAFDIVKDWLSCQHLQPLPPISENDWASLAETLFWVGHLGVQWPLETWVAPLEFGSAIEHLPFTISANLVLGIWSSHRRTIPSSWKSYQHRLLERFQCETQTLKVEFDGGLVKSHFIIPFALLEKNSSQSRENGDMVKDLIYEETMKQIYFLRNIFPDCEVYASQGYGHQLSENADFHDSTRKTGIPRASLPSFYQVSVNTFFTGIAQHALRPNTWQDYAKDILELRRAVLQTLQQVEQGLAIYFRKQDPVEILGGPVNVIQWSRCQRLLRTPPLLPVCAFDEWGFVDENTSGKVPKSEGTRQLVRRELALQEYRQMLTAFKEYTQAMSNFFDNGQAVLVMKINSSLNKSKNTKTRRMEIAGQRTKKGMSSDVFHISTVNLGDGLAALVKFQREFRKHLGVFCLHSQLEELERQEMQIVSHIWDLWYFFAYRPDLIIQNALQECTRRNSLKQKAVYENLEKSFQNLRGKGLEVKTLDTKVEWDQQPTLWLTVDTQRVEDMYSAGELLAAKINKAIHRVKDKLLRRYALNLPYTNVFIVPLVQGKSLISQAWCLFLPELLIKDDADEQIALVIQSLSLNLLEILGIETWVLPQINVAKQLWESSVELSLLCAHLRDIQKFPLELNEQETEYARSYLDQTFMRISKMLLLVLEMEESLRERWQVLSPEDLADQPNIVQAIHLLQDLHTYVMPSADFQGELEMPLSEVVEWTQRLEVGQTYTFLIFLLCATDILEKIK
jgi:hypothetical protein